MAEEATVFWSQEQQTDQGESPTYPTLSGLYTSVIQQKTTSVLFAYINKKYMEKAERNVKIINLRLFFTLKLIVFKSNKIGWIIKSIHMYT